MRLDGSDLSIIESGWYQDSKRLHNMKNDNTYTNFDKVDLF